MPVEEDDMDLCRHCEEGEQWDAFDREDEIEDGFDFWDFTADL